MQQIELENIINNIPVGVAVCEVRDGAINFKITNALMHKLLLGEDTKETVLHAKLLHRLHPHDRKNIMEFYYYLSLPNKHFKYDFRYHKDTNEYRWYHLDLLTTPIPNGITAFICVSDITEEKNNFIELQKNRHIYKSATEAAKLLLWEYDIKTGVVHMLFDNDCTIEFCKNFNVPEYIENGIKFVEDKIDIRDLYKFKEMCKKIIDGVDFNNGVFRYIMGDGNLRYTYISSTAVKNESGEVISVYGISRDITDQKHEEEKYNRAIEQLPYIHPDTIGSALINLTQNTCLETEKSYITQNIKKIRDFTAEEYFAEIVNLFDGKEAQEEVIQKLNIPKLLKDFSKGINRVTLVYPMYFKDETLHWIEGYIFMMKNPRTGDIEALTLGIDVTRRKIAENVMKNITEERFEYIGIIDAEQNTIELLNCNSDIVGLETAVRLDFDEFKADIAKKCINDEEREMYRKASSMDSIVLGISENNEYIFSYRQEADGDFTYHQTQYNWIDKERKTILTLRTDITKSFGREKAQLLEVTNALNAAKKANEAKTEFVSRISHDIRTPINIINSMVGFALEDIDDFHKLKEDLNKIKTADTFLLSLINDVLDISAMDSESIKLMPEPYPYEEFINHMINLFEPLCKEKNIKFIIKKMKAAGTIVADKSRINQITLNLLSNAIKYTEYGGTAEYISHSKLLDGGKILFDIEIKDNGIGMSEEFQKNMFKQFSQEFDNPYRPKAATGTGLGLSIVKRIVDKMNGTLTVKSELGVGTSIRCSMVFPNADADENYIRIRQNKWCDLPYMGKLKGRVLLAEDNSINAEIAVRVLKDLGLSVDTAENGLVALEKYMEAKEFYYNIILMDIQMPLLSGYETAEAIRKLKRNDAKGIPIVAMTADAFPEAVKAAHKAGMNDHIAKPIDKELLRSTLGKYL